MKVVLFQAGVLEGSVLSRVLGLERLGFVAP